MLQSDGELANWKKIAFVVAVTAVKSMRIRNPEIWISLADPTGILNVTTEMSFVHSLESKLPATRKIYSSNSRNIRRKTWGSRYQFSIKMTGLNLSERVITGRLSC